MAVRQVKFIREEKWEVTGQQERWVSRRYSDYAVRWSNFPERRNEGSNDDGGKFTARPTYK